MSRHERFTPPKGKEVVSVEAASRNHGFRIPFTSFFIVRGDGYLWSRMMIFSYNERHQREENKLRKENGDLANRQREKHREMDEVAARRDQQLIWRRK